MQKEGQFDLESKLDHPSCAELEKIASTNKPLEDDKENKPKTANKPKNAHKRTLKPKVSFLS